MRDSKPRRIQRSATVDGNLVDVDTPKFITLVKQPANQRAFGIVRSADKEDQPVATTAKRTNRSARRSQGADTQNLVSLQLPGTLDEAGAQAAVAEYGLTGFTLQRSEDGSAWVATNPSATDCTDTMAVGMVGGLVAHVKRTEATAPTEGKGALTVASLEFSAEQFADNAAVAEWCQRNSVDFDEKGLNNPSGNLVLQRAEVPEGEETRLMELESGVTATIIRSQAGNIPEGFIAVINEYAYSGWGWGQLDFNAAMADDQVGDALYDGLYMLEDLLRNILFWSELPVDVKKELVTRACGQFASYANGLLDTLPRQLLISVAGTQRSEKEHDMTTAAQQAQGAKRSDAPAAEAAPAPVMVAVGSPEFNEAVGVAVAAELQRAEEAKTKQAEEAQRAEDQKKADDEAAEAQATIRRNEITEAVKAAVGPLQEEIAALKGTTVVRSEGESTTKKTPVKRSEGDIFKGCLGITRSSARADASAAAAAEAEPGADAGNQ